MTTKKLLVFLCISMFLAILLPAETVFTETKKEQEARKQISERIAKVKVNKADREAAIKKGR